MCRTYTDSTHSDYCMGMESDMDWHGYGYEFGYRFDMEILPAVYVLHSTIEE